MFNPDRNYFLFTLLTSLPLYAVTALGQNVLQSGAIATFPMISYWISTFVQAHVASKVSGKFKAKRNSTALSRSHNANNLETTFQHSVKHFPGHSVTSCCLWRLQRHHCHLFTMCSQFYEWLHVLWRYESQYCRCFASTCRDFLWNLQYF